MTVNHDVAGSNPALGAKNKNLNRGRDFEEVDLTDFQELQQRGFDELYRQIQERMDKRNNEQ